jgi:hypothetical protein
MIRRTVIALTALLTSSAAQSEFFTYQQWLALPLSSRALYIAGVDFEGQARTSNRLGALR